MSKSSFISDNICVPFLEDLLELDSFPTILNKANESNGNIAINHEYENENSTILSYNILLFKHSIMI